MSGQHPCAAPDCSAPARPLQLMCLTCWKALPGELQRAVNRTWRNYRRDPAAYREARDAAIAWHADKAQKRTTQGQLPL